MTGYTVHTGATEKFVAGWDAIFKQGAAQKKKSKPAAAKKSVKRGAKKKSRS
jgi:hypothetical protein